MVCVFPLTFHPLLLVKTSQRSKWVFRLLLMKGRCVRLFDSSLCCCVCGWSIIMWPCFSLFCLVLPPLCRRVDHVGFLNSLLYLWLGSNSMFTLFCRRAVMVLLWPWALDLYQSAFMYSFLLGVAIF